MKVGIILTPTENAISSKWDSLSKYPIMRNAYLKEDGMLKKVSISIFGVFFLFIRNFS